MPIVRVVLAVRGAAAAAAFHADVLGQAVAADDDGRRVRIGDGELVLVEAPADAAPPVHHVAYRVARDRFDAACAWLGARAPLLRHEDDDRIRWAFWDADACYACDPAGTVLELIAFDGLPASGRRGPFSPDELLGIAEVGVPVADVLAAAEALAPLGVGPWAGAPDAGFAALGARGGTLIVVPRGRPWFPTDRSATTTPVEVALARAAAGAGEATLDGCRVLVG